MLGPAVERKPALIVGAQHVGFGQLAALRDAEQVRLGALPPGLLVLTAQPTVAFVARFLAALEARRPVALVASSWTAAELAARRDLLGPCVHLDERGQVAFRREAEGPALHPDTAVILFTSGSTGQPRAVQLSRANLAANTRAVRASLEFERATEQVLFLPLSYAFGLLGQLVPALEAGLTTRLLPRFADAKGLLDAGEARGLWSGVPSHWEALLRLTDAHPESVARVTHVVSAGAPLGPDLRRRLAARFPGAVLFNNYGQTEASPRLLSLSSRHPHFFEPPVGLPVEGVEVQVREGGRLWVRGPQVMLGYLGAPGTVPQPVHDGWLDTGDAAALEADGRVSILGRSDELFNVGGERTSPVEIEQALQAVDGVADAAVLLEPDAVYGARVVAVLVLSRPLSRAEVLAGLAPRLSPVKAPRELVVVDALPRSAHGKLSRAGLPAAKASGRRLS